MSGVQSGRSPLRPPNLNIERGGGGASFRPSRSCPGASATVLEQHSSDGAGHRPQSGKSRTPRNQKFGESPGTRGWVSQARRPKPPLGAPKPLGPSLGGQAARPRRATTRPLKLFFFLNIQAVLHSFRIAASPLPALPLPESPFGKASSHWTESSQKPTPVQPNFAEGSGPKFGAEESDRKGSEKEK